MTLAEIYQIKRKIKTCKARKKYLRQAKNRNPGCSKLVQAKRWNIFNYHDMAENVYKKELLEKYPLVYLKMQWAEHTARTLQWSKANDRTKEYIEQIECNNAV